MSLAVKKVIFENIEQILSAQLPAATLLKTINNLAHTTAKKHSAKQIELKTDAQKTAYINAEHEFNVSLNYSKNMTTKGALKRMKEPKFWRKNIEKQVLKRIEHQAFTQKKLGRNRQEKCVSNKTLEYFDLKKVQTDSFLAAQEFVRVDSVDADKKDEIVRFNLLDAAESAQTARVNELFITLKSLEIIAQEQEKDWVFLTFTCPPEYHPNPTTNSNKYNIENDFEAAKNFLNKQFKSFLKYFDKKYERGNDFFGIRVFEVHEDGCPHLHAMMFFEKSMREGIQNKMRWLHEDEGQANHFKNHEQNIVRFKSNDASAAKASSYIYKYLTTALNPQNSDLTAKRYKAAFKANNTRQYAFFGVRGCLTKRRVLKTVSKMSDVPANLMQLAQSLHLCKETKDRLEKQLAASIKFLKSDHEKVEIIEEEITNKYGEKVKRVSEIKHNEDKHSVKISDRYYKLSAAEKNMLNSSYELMQNASIYLILNNLEKKATISINYSRGEQEQNKDNKQKQNQGLCPCKPTLAAAGLGSWGEKQPPAPELEALGRYSCVKCTGCAPASSLVRCSAYGLRYAATCGAALDTAYA